MTSMTEYIDPAEQAAIDAAGEQMLFDAEIEEIIEGVGGTDRRTVTRCPGIGGPFHPVKFTECLQNNQ